jgi:putative oxidoreductase
MSQKSASSYPSQPIVIGILGNNAQYLYGLLRIVAGLLFFCHGAQKVFGWFGGVNGAPAPLLSLFGIAGAIELLTDALITIGFLTVKAAFIASGQMALAYFIGHFPQGFWPILNNGEEAVLYCFIFLFMAGEGVRPLEC